MGARGGWVEFSYRIILDGTDGETLNTVRATADLGIAASATDGLER